MQPPSGPSTPQLPVAGMSSSPQPVLIGAFSVGGCVEVCADHRSQSDAAALVMASQTDTWSRHTEDRRDGQGQPLR